MAEYAEPVKLKLKNVTISYPSLWKTELYDGKDTGKYGCTLLLPKSDKKQSKMVKEYLENAKEESGLKIKSDYVFLRDGDDSEDEAYHDHWTIRAANNRRPVVINRDKSSITEEDEVIYSGAVVNFVGTSWVQNNAYGKRINLNLLAIQFSKDGDPLGNSSTGVDVDSDFDDIDEDEDL